MDRCPKCGKDFKLSFKDKSLRRAIGFQARMFPALKKLIEKCKDYCNDCWKKKVEPKAKGTLKSTSIKLEKKKRKRH